MSVRRATYALLAGIAAGFAIELATGAVGDETALLRLGALPNSGRLDGEWWRLVTYAFLHAGPLHLLVNSVTLWWTGTIVERRVGSGAALAVYFAGVLASGAAILWVRHRHPTPGSSIGASGGIFALLAAAIVLVLTRRRTFAAFGADRGLQFGLIAFLAIGAGISFLPRVSFAGHVGGFVGGAIVAAFLRPKGSSIDRSDGPVIRSARP